MKTINKKNFIYHYILKNELAVCLLIVLLGTWFRLYKFPSIPFGLNHDTAFGGLITIDLWHQLPKYIPYYPVWNGETLLFYWQILNFAIFGISPTILRFATIIVGIITLPLFYFLARFLQGKTTAFFSLFFLCISGWHITMSKAGWAAILVPFFQTLTFVLVYKALQSNKKVFWLLSGISLAITLNTYVPAGITPFVVTLIIFYWYILNRHKINGKKFLLNIAILLTAFFIAIQPLLQFVIQNWKIYTGRTQFLAVTNLIKEQQSLTPILDNLKTSLSLLHIRANGNDLFINEPLLEKIPRYLFIVGLIYIIFRIRSFESFIIAIWLFAGFLPGFLSVPNGNHNFSILAPVYLIIGQGAKLLFVLTQKLSKQISPIGYILIALILIFSTTDAYNQYLSKNRREIWGFYPETTIVGNYMNRYKESFDFYLTDNYPRDALTFITYTKGNPFIKHYQWFEDGNQFLQVKQLNKGIMFFMFPSQQNEQIASALLIKFKGARKTYLPYINDAIKRNASLVIVVPPKEY